MIYPIFVYKSPGHYRGHMGASYQCRSVADSSEHQAALQDGWYATEAEAIAAAGELAYTHGLNKRHLAKVLKDKPWERVKPPAALVEPVEPIPEDDAPPTRQEIEEQAKLLGIKFDGRYSDKRLLERIAEAMKGT